MANAGNHRAGSEHRRKARQQMHYRASILLEGDPAPRSCAIADISESGAKVTLDSAEELPEQFILCSPRPAARGVCAKSFGATARRSASSSSAMLTEPLGGRPACCDAHQLAAFARQDFGQSE